MVVIRGTNVFSIVGNIDPIGAWDVTQSPDMTETQDGKWTLTINEQQLANGAFEYKAVYDHAWGIKEYPASGNNTQTVGEDAKYNITFTLDPSATADQLTCTLEKIEDVVISHTYTVAGKTSNTADGEEDPIFGTTWDVAATANDMTQDEATGIYSWTKENVTLTAATVYYKIAQDHAWDVSYGYSSGQDGNADYVVNEDGIYTVTFFFDPSKTDEGERVYAQLDNVLKERPNIVEGEQENSAHNQDKQRHGGPLTREHAVYLLAAHAALVLLGFHHRSAHHFIDKGKAHVGNGSSAVQATFVFHLHHDVFDGFDFIFVEL